jgi:hypothetical protein
MNDDKITKITKIIKYKRCVRGDLIDLDQNIKLYYISKNIKDIKKTK